MNGADGLPPLLVCPADLPGTPEGPAAVLGTPSSGGTLTGAGWVVWPSVGTDGTGMDHSLLDRFFADLFPVSA